MKASHVALAVLAGLVVGGASAAAAVALVSLVVSSIPEA